MALKQHLLLALESGTVYPVTLSNVNPLSFSSQRSKIGFLKTALANFAKHTSNELAACKFPIKFVFLWLLDLEVGFTLLSALQPLYLPLVPFLILFTLSRCFKTSKYLSRILLCVIQPLKPIPAHSLFHFNLETNQSYFASCFLTSKYIISRLNVVFTFKYIRRRFFFRLKSLNVKQQFATSFLTHE